MFDTRIAYLESDYLMIDKAVRHHNLRDLAVAVDIGLCNTTQSSIGLCLHELCSNRNKKQATSNNAQARLSTPAGGL